MNHKHKVKKPEKQYYRHPRYVKDINNAKSFNSEERNYDCNISLQSNSKSLLEQNKSEIQKPRRKSENDFCIREVHNKNRKVQNDNRFINKNKQKNYQSKSCLSGPPNISRITRFDPRNNMVLKNNEVENTDQQFASTVTPDLPVKQRASEEKHGGLIRLPKDVDIYQTNDEKLATTRHIKRDEGKYKCFMCNAIVIKI